MPAPDVDLSPAALPDHPARPAPPIDVRPVKGNVVIEVLRRPARTAGGLHVPEVAQGEMKRGRVVAIGPGAVDADGNRIPVDVQLGDVVLYGARWQGEEFERDGRRFRVLEPEQTLAVIPASEADAGDHFDRIAEAAY